MKKCFLLLILFISITSGYSQTWQQVWSDEFNYTGLPDPLKWNYETGCAIRNNELQDYKRERLENTRVENNNLIIQARKEQSGTCGYTSGGLNTRYKGDWTYGKVEVRAKLPAGRGVWPAIWMMSSDESYGGWPKSGEIDMMENVGYDQDKVHFNIHTESYNHVLGTGKGATVPEDDLHNTYHIYGLEWHPDKLDFYLDNAKVFTFAKESDDYKVWPFNKRFYLILNLAIGGAWGGLQGVDDAIFPTAMTIDYVRIFELQTDPGPYNITASATAGGNVSVLPLTNEYPANTNVTINATPEPGFKFIGWNGNISVTGNPVQLQIYKDIELAAMFAPLCELVRDGNFQAMLPNWKMNINDGANATSTVTGNKFHANITNGAANPWSVQLMQNGMTLTNGKSYTMSFDAYSDGDRTMRAGAGKNSAPFNTYLYSTVALTSTPKTFTYNFTMNSATDVDAKILFDMGTSAADVFISNISLCDNTITGSTHSKGEADNSIFFVYKNSGNYNVSYTLQKSQEIELALFDSVGKKITILNKGYASVGEHTSILRKNKTYHSAGFYILKLETEEGIFTKKVYLE